MADDELKALKAQIEGLARRVVLLEDANEVRKLHHKYGYYLDAGLYEADPDGTNRQALLYLNRLSDLLFILSRAANPDGDVKWTPGGAR